jgi:hypothetical protein
MKRTFWFALSSLAIAAASGAAPIGNGNLVIYRVGTGAAALGTTATAVFLDEYTPTGSLVQSIALGTTGTSAVTAVGNASTEGILSLSPDKQYITFTGYRKDAGGTSPASDTPATTNRIVGRLDIAGNLDVTTALTDATGTIRSAATVDGTQMWSGTSAGVRYVNAPYSSSTSVVIDSRNSRQVLMNGNVLYASNGSTSTTTKVQHYGATPTVATVGTPVVTLASGDAVNGIFMADLNGSVAGDDTLYILSTVENKLRKYSFDGSVWTAAGDISASTSQNITGSVDPLTGAVQLYTTSGGTLYTLADATGSAGTLAGTLTSVATAGTNTAFRGIALIPEPASLGGLAAGGILLIRRRRND